jgi:hypothetical protein
MGLLCDLVQQAKNLIDEQQPISSKEGPTIQQGLIRKGIASPLSIPCLRLGAVVEASLPPLLSIALPGLTLHPWIAKQEKKAPAYNCTVNYLSYRSYQSASDTINN